MFKVICPLAWVDSDNRKVLIDKHTLLVPDQARYIAVDSDGRRFAYNSKPVKSKVSWVPRKNDPEKYWYIDQVSFAGDWGDSLQEVL